MNFTYKEVISHLEQTRDTLPAAGLSTMTRLGEHRSIFRGPSYDLYGIREYDPERDPANQIIFSPISSFDEDAVWARETIEPREERLMLLCRLSSSLDFAISGQFSKQQLLLETMGVLGLLAVNGHDPVGLMGFTDKIVMREPLRHGSGYVYYLLKRVYDFLEQADGLGRIKKEPRRKTDFLLPLDFARKNLDRSCVLAMIMDEAGCQNMFNPSLLDAVQARHELIFFLLQDEKEFAFRRYWGYLQTENLETGEQIVVPMRRLTGMRQALEEEREKFRENLRRRGIYSVVLQFGTHLQALSHFIGQYQAWCS